MLKIEREVPKKLAEKKEDHKHDAIVQFCCRMIQIFQKHFQQDGLKFLSLILSPWTKASLTGPINWNTIEKTTRDAASKNLVLPNLQMA